MSIGDRGTVDGVIVGVDAVDRFPFPLLLVALTAKVYVAPLVRPVMVSVVFGDVKETGVWAIPASNGVMEYPVMGLPLSDGACRRSTWVWSHDPHVPPA